MNYKIKKISGDASFREFYRLKKNNKTSIIIFDNAEEKTTEVKFSDLVVEKYKEDKFAEVFGDIVIIENKGDIKGVSDVLVSQATREELLSNPICSLNGKDYNKKEIIVGEGYEMIKLGDICEFMPKSKRNASFGQSTGQYNFYTSSEKVQKCDVVDYIDECLIIGSGGVANIKLDKNFSCSADNLFLPVYPSLPPMKPDGPSSTIPGPPDDATSSIKLFTSLISKINFP